MIDDVGGFRADTKVAVEMQLHSRNFKPKRGDGGGQGYSLRLFFQTCRSIQVEGRATPSRFNSRKRAQRSQRMDSNAPESEEDMCRVEPARMGR